MKRLLLVVLLVAGCAAPTPSGSAPKPQSSVTPAPSRAAATATPAPTANPAVGQAAIHIVGEIDHLAALVASGGSGINEWLIAEGNYTVNNYELLHGSGLAPYQEAILAAVSANLDGGDVVSTLFAIAALRGDMAALMPAGAVVPTFTAAPTPVPAGPVTIKGKGEQNSKPFKLAAADYTILLRGTSPGYDNVILHLVGKGSDYSEYIWNEIADTGKYRYETILYEVPSGAYYLEADLPGNWIVTFTPLTP